MEYVSCVEIYPSLPAQTREPAADVIFLGVCIRMLTPTCSIDQRYTVSLQTRKYVQWLYKIGITEHDEPETQEKAHRVKSWRQTYSLTVFLTDLTRQQGLIVSTRCIFGVGLLDASPWRISLTAVLDGYFWRLRVADQVRWRVQHITLGRISGAVFIKTMP